MSDTRWCSYRELAEVWGVALPAAKARIRRARWHRIKGNDGVMHVETPLSALAASPPTLQATLPHTDPATAVLPLEHAAVAALVDELRTERNRVRTDAETLRQELGKLRERAARAEGEVGPLREALADLSARLDRAEAVLALPWWRRLFG